ncbi:MAG: hypothetical protein R3Y08_08550 [Rikenellaceae bacterium]
MKYIIRSTKYFLLLCSIFAILILYRSSVGDIGVTYGEQLSLFMADRGALKILCILLLAAAYPRFGFVKREVEGSVVENRDQIVVAMEMKGFTLREERDNILIFRANTILRRIAFMGEDTIEVSQQGDKILIDGIRKSVVYIAYYLEGFIENSKRGESKE